MKASDFDYDLPAELIAQRPTAEREAARLLVHDVGRDATSHRTVADLPQLLESGDLLVVNDTRVRRARLAARRPGGGRAEVLLIEREAGARAIWRALVRPAARLRPGMELTVEGHGLRLVAVERARDHGGELAPEWLLELVADGEDEEAAIERAGSMPLPPYVERAADEQDERRYQTVYARSLGAVAAPTAGLHLTEALLASMEASGVRRATVTLHVGPGTFRPVEVEDVERHPMHAERFELPVATARAIDEARARGGRVVAVGTTTVRVLESRATSAGGVEPGSGSTDLFLRPGRELRAVDAILTNFHLPRSTLLMLVAAFAGTERVLRLYREAVDERYRFYSYGDAMFLTR
ncbi:tRNA preQ1(34) S-adenosylmethionine ribosyltransferase-isomerase QueA [Engelhardtia mirabilis]|uniref:S-adenosylmethionine:tRNA ribosyltransferase-isomerase n=1 Tax=Engelhardtia mirabilis TaxID=2528011 RepID=A0A518BQG7_9BACT|nr:S-adenosylmethionine:tRNA ribosyltransferase-isomerase [Planctomycetes bacterium Pla133]QDV03552.1 S-adenosylmethionine:tRNA ribosyltransferase-isomerase [Planctomycetes bacterium Pla86]